MTLYRAKYQTSGTQVSFSSVPSRRRESRLMNQQDMQICQNSGNWRKMAHVQIIYHTHGYLLCVSSILKLSNGMHPRLKCSSFNLSMHMICIHMICIYIYKYVYSDVYFIYIYIYIYIYTPVYIKMYLRIQILLYNNIWLKQKIFTLKPLQAPHVVQPSF